MYYLLPLLILAAEPTTSIDLEGEEAVDIYRCDFDRQMLHGEERAADINYDAWPDHWTRRRDREHPAYVKIGIAGDDPPADAPAGGGAAPRRWLQIDLDGGAGAALSPPLGVSPRFTYLVDCRVRTEDLKHDDVYVSVSFFDEDDRLVERRESPRLKGTGGEWRTLRIRPFTPRSRRVSRAVVGLHVAPAEQADLKATAMFDDVRMARLPRMTLTANSPHHVYTEPESIVLTCEISGVREPAPELHLRLFDVYGRLVDDERRQMSGELIEAGGPGAAVQAETYAGSLQWRPRIREPGFYRAQSHMRTQQGVIHLRSVTLALIRPAAASDSLRRAPGGPFGWSLPRGENPLSLEAMAALVSYAGVQWVKLPAWFEPQDQKYADRLARFVERVDQDGVTVVGVLDEPPAEVRPLFGSEQSLPIASVFVDRDAWQTAIDPVMSRLSPVIRWWQLGADDDASFHGFPGLDAKIEEVRGRLARFGQKVHLGFAWHWLEDRPPQSGKTPAWDFLSYMLNPDDPPLTAAELPRYLSRLDGAASQRWTTLQPLPRSQYDLTTRTRDLMERMVAAKLAGAQAVFVPRPFDADSGLMNADGTPSELFLVWRTTAGMLSGAEYVGAIEMPGGSTNFIFSRGKEAFMLIWSERPVRETLYLGESLMQVDPWDRRVSLPGRDGQHTVEAGPVPVFLVGVNLPVAQWRMSFQFESPRLASTFGRLQLLEYRYRNPFPQGVSGRVTFHTPDVWDVEREKASMKMAAGEGRIDVLRVALRPTASSGPQQLQIDFEITAEREYRFSLWRTIDVGLGDVSMEISSRLDEQGRLVVEQQFINRSTEPVSFLCQLFAPGRPRIRRPVHYLNYGRTTVLYHLPNGEELVGQTLLLRAEEINGDRALNHRFEAK